MLLDFHTHAFPDALGPITVKRLGKAAHLEPQTDGTIGGLKEAMEQEGVDISVVHSIATKPSQQTNVNNFAIEVDKDSSFVAFGTVHPDAPDAMEELERLHAAGIRGIKFHPEYQQFYPDDEKMKLIYKKIASLGFVTLFHAGIDHGFPAPYHGMPERFVSASRWFDSPVVLAHWGALAMGEAVLKENCGLPLFLDTSFGYGVLSKELALKILDKHGIDNILFATDMPWQRPAWTLEHLNSLELSQQEMDKICYRNGAKLLGIKVK